MKDFYCFFRSLERRWNMPFSQRRKYERKPYVTPLRYYLTALDMDKLKVKEIEYGGVSVDICEGGLGMITDYPLNEGDILFFKDEIKVNNFIATSGVVKWLQRLADTTYRLGLEFSDVRLHSGGTD
jgi:c-di-GMP-binding flagellar brake protein YcgR